MALSAGKRGQAAMSFSSGAADIPIIDMAPFMEDPSSAAAKAEIAKAAKGLHEFSALVIKDPRVDEAQNDRFVDMLEKYFEVSDGARDARPDFSFQVGVTPEGTEVPRNHCERLAGLREGEKAKTLCPPEADPKWRFFWRIGPQPETTKYPGLNADPVVPPEFPEWAEVMDMWGDKMLAALHTLAGMAATGLDLPPTAFQDKMRCGPHLLAPTGSDFRKFGGVDTVLASYHYDLNFLTIHGKSRFPGLYIWLRDGRRVGVKVPPGHLIVQAGKQMEHLTGGHVQAGYHEVVVSEATAATIASRTANGESLWRVSSTLFGHIASDQVLEPLGKYATPDALHTYPPTDAGQSVQNELDAIMLGTGYGEKERPAK